MGEPWGFDRFRLRLGFLVVFLWFLPLNLGCCWCLNSEGLALLRFRERVINDPYGALVNWNRNDGEENPCSWFGVGCSDGKVVILNLKDLCLEGTLGPELGNLIHIKSIILHNNSFSGIIPKEIEELKDLEVFNIGWNNFSGPLPSQLGYNPPLAILLLDNNRFLGSLPPELHELSMLSELQVDEKQLSYAVLREPSNGKSISWKIGNAIYAAYRRLLQERKASSSSKRKSKSRRSHRKHLKIESPSPSPSQSPVPSPSPLPSPSIPPVGNFLVPAPSPAPASNRISPAQTDTPSIFVRILPSPTPPSSVGSSRPERSTSGKSKHLATWIILSVGLGAPVIIILSIGILICRSNKAVIVKPWATGLSGQLQKAFVTGVPKLKRSELETACEDFSNIIGSLSDGMVYKGTLSSGVEIAVISTTVTSNKNWTKHLEGQFRKKVDTLSKVNHKNFVNLLGYCEEEKPFTRMMVFEYAPNGTLFEHLHVKEAEHLNWSARLRIAMGMAYCLEHMHQLTPPIIQENLSSSSVYLTEDYAGKISDFGFWNEGITMAKTRTSAMESSSAPETLVYDFGVVLLEMITGRLPYSENDGFLVNWASDYLRRKRPVGEMVDPTLKSFQEEELEKLCEVVICCINPDPKRRPIMRDVSARLREITAVTPDGATPRLSPLWWAELEILSTEAS